VLSADGRVLESLNMGGGEATANPDAHALNIQSSNGTIMIRIGTDTPCCTPVVRLQDSQTRPRLSVALDTDGNPSIQMFDADGKVVWSAP
jgi:hypothetical protein